MFTPQAIGYVQSPYKDPSEIPRGFGAKHDAEGVLSIAPEFQLDSPTSRVSRTCS